MDNVRNMLERIVNSATIFRSTAIVEDDFPTNRDRFDTDVELAKIVLNEPSPLNFDELRSVNSHRCEVVFGGHPNWSWESWALAVSGEWGEACNEIKKFNRGDYAGKHEEFKTKVAHELADTITYIDLLAQRMDIDLGKAIVEKFNIVSARRGSDIHL